MLYQTFLKDCDCKNNGVIIHLWDVVCRWCRKPYGKGGCMSYEEEDFKQPELPKEGVDYIKPIYKEHDNYQKYMNKLHTDFWEQTNPKIQKLQQSKIMNEFNWTDDLVKEFAAFYALKSSTWVRDVDVHTFKQSKQQSVSSNKDWEIESIRDKTNGKIWEHEYWEINGVKNHGFMGNSYEYVLIQKLSQLNHYEIHSVRRLSDNEVFSVGDTCEQGVIKQFKISTWSTQMTVYLEGEKIGLTAWFKFIKKAKQPLFKTEDGIDRFWHVDGLFRIGFRDAQPSLEFYPEVYKYFPTEAAAKEYIVLNKPCLSIKDILGVAEYAAVTEMTGYTFPHIMLSQEKLKQIVQERIK